jgi:hypothetical protein
MDITLTTFKAIVNFTESLGDIFANKNHALKLYCHLISKTTFCHDKAIEKHIGAFRKFCITNRDAILENDENKIQVNNITYSGKVFINVKQILCMCDSDQKKATWKHLLVISALVDPMSRAKEILRNKKEEENTESNFLSKIMDKVEKNIDVDADPMSAVSSIMSSGMFSEMIEEMNTGMQNGSIDLGKLLGTVQTMVSETNGGTSGTEGTNMPDLGGIMSMIGPMLGPMMATMNTNPQQPSRSTSVPKMLEIE